MRRISRVTNFGVTAYFIHANFQRMKKNLGQCGKNNYKECSKECSKVVHKLNEMNELNGWYMLVGGDVRMLVGIGW